LDFKKGGKPLAVVKVSGVNPFDSEANIISGTAVPDYSRAILRERKLGGSKLRIWVQSTPASAALNAIHRSLSSSKDLEVVSEREAANVQVIQAKGQIQLYSPDGRQLSRPVDSTAADVNSAILQQILQWGRWFLLLGLENPQSALRVGLTIRPVERELGARGSPLPTLGRPQMTFSEGDPVDVTIRNESNQSLFVSILVLSSDRSISVLYPSRGLAGAAAELRPGASQTLDFQPRATLPSCLDATTDNFLLIATTKPIDLFPYEQKGICEERSRGRDALKELLDQGSIGFRGWSQDPGQWATLRTTVAVQRKRQ
jgi:hypothetical protein